MKIGLLLAAAVGALGALAGFLVAASGIIPIKASSGHFAITEWILQFAKHRSVATHTLGMSVPPLDDPALVLRGAGAYESACRPCHGSPELKSPRIPRAMLPPPPYLPDRIADWEPEELFYIVKHGIKFTGMPAWPSQQRDDEVWAVVAFLVAYPELDTAGYRRLVFGGEPAPPSSAPLAALEGSDPPPRAARDTCARCHGVDGRGRGNPAFPKLAGQRADYVARALRAYASDRRQSGIMQPIAAALREPEIDELARYYARLPPPAASDAAPSQRGREIATGEGSAEGVPACAECHGPQPTRRNPAYPVLAGQYSDYLVQQLELMRQRRRGGSEYIHVMHKVIQRLEAEQLREVAAYYAALPAGGSQR